MTHRPDPTQIFHITHVENLVSIIENGGLLSDAEMLARGGPDVAVGISGIKERRLSLPVRCHQGDMVGDYVPFYFCPRSIMLYLLYMANHPSLTYHEGQGPIVHLQADADSAISWATETDVHWAFSHSNAGAGYASFGCTVAELDEINWDAVKASDFRSPPIKEGKQAEFLLQRFAPWELIQSIGVHSPQVEEQVSAALANASHQPPVAVQPRWYF